MSVALMQSVHQHLVSAGLLTGIEAKYFRWTDADVLGGANFIVYRNNGGGLRDSQVERPDLKLLMCFKSTDIAIGNDKADAVFAKLGDGTFPVGTIKLEPMGAVTGPYYFENGRGVFEINLRCYVGAN